MNYHLNRNGNHMGIFPLEELHRRRVAGELSGSDLVWCEGMAQWQTLDEVLRQKLPGAFPPLSAAPYPTPPPSESKPRSNRTLIWVVAAVMLVLVCGLVFLGIIVAGFIHGFEQTLTNRGQTAGGSTSDKSAMDLASEPVAWTSNSVTTADVNVQRRAFRVRQYLAGYQLRGERDTDCDQLCLGLIQNWIACNYDGTVDTNLPSLSELSEKLAADPQCTDPLVLTVAAVNTDALYPAIERLERAVKGFEHSKHLAYPKFYATVVLADKVVKNQAQRRAELDALALQRLREAFADGSLRPEDQEDLGEILLYDYGSGFFRRNQSAVYFLVQDQGKPFQWLALTLEGEFQINEAWRVRGSGYASTVSDQQWKGFSQHLEQAGTCLSKACQLDPSRPLAPCLMITVALGDSDSNAMRQWFDCTLAAQVDFDRAWSCMRWGLRPRWGGSTDAMLALGEVALNTRHFETDVPRKYFDAVTEVAEDTDVPAGEHIYGRDDIWPHLQAMYEGYIAEPAQAGNRDGWRSAYAIVAYLAGHYEVAGKQLQALNWQPQTGYFYSWGVDLTLMPLEVAARTGSQAAAVAAAETNRTSGDIAPALKQYRDLAARTDLDDRTRSFVQERLASLAVESRLQSHDWVDYLPTDTNLTGWYVERGHCTLNPDGSLDVVSGATGHLLYSRARLGRDFEVRGQFEVERTSNRSFQAGLAMGLPQLENYDSWYSFRVKRSREDGDIASFSPHWTRRQILKPAALNDYTNTFYFRFQNGKVSATVNNQEVIHEADPPATIYAATNEFMLGLGAYNDQNDTVIRYRNVQARSLATPAGFQLSAPVTK